MNNDDQIAAGIAIITGMQRPAGGCIPAALVPVAIFAAKTWEACFAEPVW